MKNQDLPANAASTYTTTFYTYTCVDIYAYTCTYTFFSSPCTYYNLLDACCSYSGAEVVSLMLDPSITGSPMLDHLIDEVELVSHTDVPIEGDVVDVEVKIDEPVAAKGAADDVALAIAPSSYSSR
ncbi:hypothetical protein Ancab_014556 [Ancistrocladus abbreviatus]